MVENKKTIVNKHGRNSVEKMLQRVDHLVLISFYDQLHIMKQHFTQLFDNQNSFYKLLNSNGNLPCLFFKDLFRFKKNFRTFVKYMILGK